MPGARLDLFLLECVGTIVKTTVEPRAGMPLWDGGLKEVAAAKLKEMGVSDQEITVVDLARMMGVLGPDPAVVVVNPPKKRRARRCT